MVVEFLKSIPENLDRLISGIISPLTSQESLSAGISSLRTDTYAALQLPGSGLDPPPPLDIAYTGRRQDFFRLLNSPGYAWTDAGANYLGDLTESHLGNSRLEWLPRKVSGGTQEFLHTPGKWFGVSDIHLPDYSRAATLNYTLGWGSLEGLQNMPAEGNFLSKASNVWGHKLSGSNMTVSDLWMANWRAQTQARLPGIFRPSIYDQAIYIDAQRHAIASMNPEQIMQARHLSQPLPPDSPVAMLKKGRSKAFHKVADLEYQKIVASDLTKENLDERIKHINEAIDKMDRKIDAAQNPSSTNLTQRTQELTDWKQTQTTNLNTKYQELDDQIQTAAQSKYKELLNQKAARSRLTLQDAEAQFGTQLKKKALRSARATKVPTPAAFKGMKGLFRRVRSTLGTLLSISPIIINQGLSWIPGVNGLTKNNLQQWTADLAGFLTGNQSLPQQLARGDLGGILLSISTDLAATVVSVAIIAALAVIAGPYIAAALTGLAAMGAAGGPFIAALATAGTIGVGVGKFLGAILVHSAVGSAFQAFTREDTRVYNQRVADFRADGLTLAEAVEGANKLEQHEDKIEQWRKQVQRFS